MANTPLRVPMGEYMGQQGYLASCSEWKRHLYASRWESIIINNIKNHNRDKFMAKAPTRAPMGEYIRANSKTTKNMARGGTRAVSDPIKRPHILARAPKTQYIYITPPPPPTPLKTGSVYIYT